MGEGAGMVILVTGSNGMIGRALVDALLERGDTVIGVDRTECRRSDARYRHCRADLAQREALRSLVEAQGVERIIHLAALAHTEGEKDLSYERYRHVNVECAKNVFEAAGERPVLFISTVDVYGFYDGRERVTGQTPVCPVSNYAKSKAEAEEECRKLKRYDIFRFSPVYSESVKRDIQKRYYLKYPNIAYRVGRGMGYEVLALSRAVDAMTAWCRREPREQVTIVKDPELLWTPDCIEAEKRAGRAKHVIRVPKWAAQGLYRLAKLFFGKSNMAYLLNKAVCPLRSSG